MIFINIIRKDFIIFFDYGQEKIHSLSHESLFLIQLFLRVTSFFFYFVLKIMSGKEFNLS